MADGGGGHHLVGKLRFPLCTLPIVPRQDGAPISLSYNLLDNIKHYFLGSLLKYTIYTPVCCGSASGGSLLEHITNLILTEQVGPLPSPAPVPGHRRTGVLTEYIWITFVTFRAKSSHSKSRWSDGGLKGGSQRISK